MVGGLEKHDQAAWQALWVAMGKFRGQVQSAGALPSVRSRSLVNVVGGCLFGTHARFPEMVGSKDGEGLGFQRGSCPR